MFQQHAMLKLRCLCLCMSGTVPLAEDLLRGIRSQSKSKPLNDAYGQSHVARSHRSSLNGSRPDLFSGFPTAHRMSLADVNGKPSSAASTSGRLAPTLCPVCMADGPRCCKGLDWRCMQGSENRVTGTQDSIFGRRRWHLRTSTAPHCALPHLTGGS